MDDKFFEESLRYHASFPPGKIGITSTKPCSSQHDLSLSYTPGVGAPCLAIHKDLNKVWEYTNRGNTVAIISDGSAVLGLGDIGPEAGLPVMEGKTVLFKKFANIDSFPLCISIGDCKNEDDHLEKLSLAISALYPSLGAINLEDIKAPICFALQELLDQKLDIPVFHDDQDGTAIIVIAGIINALKIVNKNFKDIKIVINGAGAAGIASGRLLAHFNVPKENIFLCDTQGLITHNRKETNKYKLEFAQNAPDMTLSEAIEGADVFIGVSARNTLTGEMVKKMSKLPIIFALANPIPEIMPEVAIAAGAKIIGTGRSDYPNQVNNSLGFPGLFRAALDTRSNTINTEMKIAAAYALADLVNEPIHGTVQEILVNAYPEDAKQGVFHKENPLSENYVLPKQFDPRVVPKVARYVAKAAMKTGVASVQISDLDQYEKKLFDLIH